jgi:hypothetical protein
VKLEHVTNGVCDLCGSGVIEETGAHIRKDEDMCPNDPEFWWDQHNRVIGEKQMTFPRNPNDIKQALGMTPQARWPIIEAHKAATRFYNINQCQSAAETLAYTMIARLLDAGVLQRPDTH